MRNRLRLAATEPQFSTRDRLCLHFNIGEAMHRRIKIECALRGMTMREMADAAFECYWKKYPSKKVV